MLPRPRHSESPIVVLRPFIVACAVFALSATATAAPRRHTHLVKSEPAANDSLAVAPSAIRLWFSERIEFKVTRVKLTNAGGRATALGEPTRRDDTEDAPVVATLSKPLAPGRYTVGWSTASKDGHSAKGTFGFVVLGPR